jgi:hypothetical protein
MGITLNIGQVKITAKKFVGEVEDKMIMVMQYTGEQFVRDARRMTRSDGGFGDVTGNLRSSIGYFILKDGQIIKENLRGKSSGKSAARQFVDLLPKKTGLQLIGIAGMNYASLVESKGKNVISIQAETALIDLKDLMKDVTK